MEGAIDGATLEGAEGQHAGCLQGCGTALP